jgi:hypothetical protein
MNWIHLSIILFAVGFVEQALSEYQNLISVRLRVVKHDSVCRSESVHRLCSECYSLSSPI